MGANAGNGKYVKPIKITTQAQMKWISLDQHSISRAPVHRHGPRHDVAVDYAEAPRAASVR